MDPTRERPWAEHEKVDLLTEILKAEPVPSSVFFKIIRDMSIQPKWWEMPLPQGRSLRSSQNFFQELVNHASVFTEYPGSGPASRVSRDVPKKRPLPDSSGPPVVRTLQPRFCQSFTSDINASSLSSPSTAHKKRGRPTKAETKARADAAAARGEVYPPQRPSKIARTSAPLSVRDAYQIPGETSQSHRSPMPETTTMSSSLRPDPSSNSFSAKRRRCRSGKEQGEASDQIGPSPYSPGIPIPSQNPGGSPIGPSSSSGHATTCPTDKALAENVLVEGLEEYSGATVPRTFKDTVGI